jgi:hypothetical protein
MTPPFNLENHGVTVAEIHRNLAPRWNYSELRTEHLNERFETSRASRIFAPASLGGLIRKRGDAELPQHPRIPD